MNRLPATITAIDIHGSVALVEADTGGCRFTATLVGAGDEVSGWRIGMPVMLLFQETEVALAKNLSGLISMRNRMPAHVTAIDAGKLLTRVSLNFGGHAIDSIVTTRSARMLALSVGDAVEALVKSNEMTVVPKDVA
jgi:molybdate transport system regulatory protein